MSTIGLLRRLAYAVLSPVGRRFYGGLLQPRDDFYLRYFGHQYGTLQPIDVQKLFPGITKVDSLNVLKPFLITPGTSLHVGEIVVLCALAKFFDSHAICEIGTFDGVTALNLAASCPDAKITTIDLPLDHKEGTGPIVPDKSNMTARDQVGIYFRGTDLEPRISQVFADSYSLDWRRLKGPFDFVFIDGSHDYNFVMRDTQNAFRHLTKNGVIVWHDYGQSLGATKAIDEMSKQYPIKAIRGTRFAVYVE